MQNGIDEWAQNDGEWQSQPNNGNVRVGSGGWHWLLSLVSIVIVTLFSMGMAWLTRWVDERPVWMMGLIFMVPTGALMLATMLVEGATSAMTPGTSRKPQIRLAIIVTIATFLVAVICDLIYLQGFKKPLAPAQSTVQPTQVSERILLIWDQTASMNENGVHEEAIRTAEKMLDQLPGVVQVALVSDGETILFAAYGEDQKQCMADVMKQTPAKGRMYYEEALAKAIEMINNSSSQEKTRSVFFSDGRHAWSKDGQFGQGNLLLNDPVALYWVQFADVPEEYRKMAEALNECYVVSPQDTESILKGLVSVQYDEKVAPAEVPKEIRLQQDLIRNRDLSAIVITCVMMVLEGLSLGICLSLMFSVSGQFRAQYLISPLMGVLSFVLLKFVMDISDMSTWWIKEGLAFSLLGVVFMTKNRFGGKRRTSGSSLVQDDSSW